MDVSRTDTANWTIDAPNGYLPTQTAFFLPTSVSQQLTDVASQQGGFGGGYTARLSESIIGYGALEENSTGSPRVVRKSSGRVPVAPATGTLPRNREAAGRVAG